FINNRIKDNSIRFINSVIENIDIRNSYPFITANNLNLEIKNSTFSNFYSDSGYIFEIINSYNHLNVIINDSTFKNTSSILTGKYLNTKISNVIFKDIASTQSIPAFSNAVSSSFKIENSMFYNLILSKGLFNEESSYDLNNIKFNNITSNSKALLYFVYSDVKMNIVEFNDITCIGDRGDSSFILYDSSENDVNMEINNLIGKNSQSNGPFIKIIGDSASIIINNSYINNIKSYGSIIDIFSNKVTIKLL
ncbi:hypothetical protein BCR36DRAFT_288589, partial [Piromyces finnis]